MRRVSRPENSEHRACQLFDNPVHVCDKCLGAVMRVQQVPRCESTFTKKHLWPWREERGGRTWEECQPVVS